MWKYEKKYFSEVVKKSKNLSDVCRNLGLKSYYGNRQTIKIYIEKYDLDTSHFWYHTTGGGFSKNELKDILVENSTYRSTNNLKKRLYKDGLKERKCELCGQGEEWNGMKISLILDHINGIGDDNRLENLRIVCPNCNAGLETHCSKNIGNGSNSRYKYEPRKYFCNCGKEITKQAKMCSECSQKKQRKVERPSYEQLLKDIKETNYTQTGKKYGVSDNAIRKWIKNYEKDRVV